MRRNLPCYNDSYQQWGFFTVKLASNVPCAFTVLMCSVSLLLYVLLGTQQCNIEEYVKGKHPNLDSPHVAYPYKYRFIVDQPQKCQHKPFLVVIVPVAPNEVMERDSIRNTWGNDKLVQERYAMVLFLLGLPSGKNAELQQARIHQENVRHQDMLQSNFIDSSKNATIKMMVMLEWLRDRCPQAHFAVKVDKDILLNIRDLMSMLFSLDIPHRNYLTGQLQNSNSETITLYPLGKCYIMSMDMPAKILMASKEIKPIRKDDVYIGICLELLNIAPVNPPKPEQFVFIPPKLYDRCNISQLIAVVTYTPVQMVSFWNDVHKPGSPC